MGKYFPGAEYQLSRICLTYLSFDYSKTGYREDDLSLSGHLKLRPFVRYAATYWGAHAARCEARDDLRIRISEFLDDKIRLSSAVQVLFLRKPKDGAGSQDTPKDPFPLAIAAYFDLRLTVKSLLESGAQVDQKDEHLRTALHYAAMNGNPQMVQFLLDRGISSDETDYEGATALHLAAEMGRPKVVRRLLDAGVNTEIHISKTTI
jgi:Ankyrin repeats (3 copies)